MKTLPSCHGIIRRRECVGGDGGQDGEGEENKDFFHDNSVG